MIPVTNFHYQDHLVSPTRSKDFSLTSFMVNVAKSGSTQIAGIYADRNFAFSITQQPASQPGFVSTTPDVVTQFSLASNYGSIGIVAHNYLAGTSFFNLKSGQELFLVHGNGKIDRYAVTEIRQYQALTPNSPYSSFVNLSAPDVTITYKQLFYETYGLDGHLILQTCIEKDGSDSWGRYFVIAEKIQS